jgi:hypothetical protein
MKLIIKSILIGALSVIAASTFAATTNNSSIGQGQGQHESQAVNPLNQPTQPHQQPGQPAVNANDMNKSGQTTNSQSQPITQPGRTDTSGY